jgi:uncharacterized membrane protein HdeD (DUF308 family)
MLSHRTWRGWALASIIGVAVYVLYAYVASGAWIPAILIGVWFPVLGIQQWMRLRAHESPDAADRLLSVILAPQIGYLLVADMHSEQTHSSYVQR